VLLVAILTIGPLQDALFGLALIVKTSIGTVSPDIGASAP